MIWIYKCNARQHPSWVLSGNWEDVFKSKRTQEWGSTQWVPDLARAQPGDVIIAYQTDRNELVGLARVVDLRPRQGFVDLMLRPIRRIGMKVRPLKKANGRIAAIPALQGGPIRTMYEISAEDARRLLRAAGTELPDVAAISMSEPKRHFGAGFGDSKRDREVERAAIAVVTKYYQSRGWTVCDRSVDRIGYDLHCLRRRRELHVEVKGASGSEVQFVITRNEYSNWCSDRAYVLGLVTNALTEPHVSLFVGDSGLSRFRFVPVSYFSTLRANAPEPTPRAS